MPRQQAIFPQINFINGLITETTALQFPENAVTETWNTIFDRTGRVYRRPGLDVETGFQLVSLQTVDPNDVYSEYFWEIVGTQDADPILVLQRGSILYFFRTPDTLQFSTSGYFQTIDLQDYVPSGSVKDPAVFKCSYAEGRGNLLITNEACDPLYLSYEESTQTIIATGFSIKYRDVRGLEDGLGLNERPAMSAATLATDNPQHYYNLLNQGWHISTSISQWDTDRSDMPSNADYIAYYRASETDVFDPARVNTTFSAVANTPAPKGHFILDAGSPSRTQAMGDEGFGGVSVPETTSARMNLVTATTLQGGTVTRPLSMFDQFTNQPATSATVLANGAYCGKTLPATTSIYSFIAFSSTTNAFNGSGTFQIYGKTGAAPISATDGTLLGSIVLPSNTTGQFVRVLVLPSPVSLDHVWLRNVSGGNRYITELFVISSTPEYNRPQTVAFYAGRSWFGGLANEGGMNSIYFSQIIERNEQYGQCYQKNDPTDENLFDLLADDGGVITIPDIGLIRGMIPYQSSLIVIASNGVWTISGSSRGPFRADDYQIRKISDISTLSTNSIVLRRGVPIWWAEEAIYTIQYDANYDTFQIVSLTEQRIARFIANVPLENRSYVRGVYDYNKDILYWLYRQDPFTSPADRHVYNRVLVMDGLSGAFYPWSFAETGLFRIKGFIMARIPEGSTTPTIKYIVENPIDNTTTFAEIKDVTNWVDWFTQGDQLDYSSYFITGYKTRGQGAKDGFVSYFIPFMEEEEGSSLRAQFIFDYTTQSSTGRWSSNQQCYKDGPFTQSVRFRRLKVRGHGKALQIKFTSETGKPFTIIGWTTLESVASDL